jgi:hypothetical protein
MLYTSKKTSALKLLAILGFGLLSFTSSAYADHNNHSNDYENASVRLFSTYEANGTDYIEGIGIGFTTRNPDTKLGFEFSTSINNAEVTATDGYIEDYFAWQGSAKVGLFSNISIYAELGVDLTELFFHDLRYDVHNENYDGYQDDVDAFVGVGAGLKAGPLQIEAFSRLREIDSQYWEAESEVFTGAQLSISF